MATASKLHQEAILKHRQSSEPVYQLYSKISTYHQQCDASQQHKAWMQVLGQCRSPTELYTSIYQHIDTGYDKIECITPANQTDAECFKELKLFTILSALPHDNPLHTLLIAQENLTLEGAAAAMLCVNIGKKLASTKLEQAHAALGGCWLWVKMTTSTATACNNIPHFFATS